MSRNDLQVKKKMLLRHVNFVKEIIAETKGTEKEKKFRKLLHTIESNKM